MQNKRIIFTVTRYCKDRLTIMTRDPKWWCKGN